MPYKRYEHLDGLELADYGDGDVGAAVQVLIGVDFYYSFLSGRIIRGKEGPVALESCLGWVLAGCNSSRCDDAAVYTNATHNHSITLLSEGVNESIARTLEQFWKIESVSEIDDN